MLCLGWGYGLYAHKLVDMAESTVHARGKSVRSKSAGKAEQRAKSPLRSELDKSYRWRPLACLEPSTSTPARIALIVLNRPLSDMVPHLMQLWNRSVIRSATDGAANHLCNIMRQSGTEFIPDLLTGDFDSVKPEVLIYMKEKGVKVIRTPDQNFTDFTKCLRVVVRTLEHNKLEVDCIVALGAIGGRVDLTFSNINTLFEASKLTDLPLYLIGEDNLVCLLKEGHHIIEVNTGLEGDYCSLIPVGCHANNVKTEGLVYNLENQRMQFGGLISTCNSVGKGSNYVTVDTDSPLIWTMTIRRLRLKEQVSHV